MCKKNSCNSWNPNETSDQSGFASQFEKPNPVQKLIIPVGGRLELACDPCTDRTLHVNSGFGFICIQESNRCRTHKKCLCPGNDIFIPANSCQTIVNNGNIPLSINEVPCIPVRPTFEKDNCCCV